MHYLRGWGLEHSEWDEVEVGAEDEHDLAGVPLGQVASCSSGFSSSPYSLIRLDGTYQWCRQDLFEKWEMDSLLTFHY